MPTVFITVDTALHRIACINSRSRVLVHAAAGGVGLAALQVIAGAGGIAVATAGSPAKRALLRTLGATQVMGSRDTLFVGEVALKVRSSWTALAWGCLSNSLCPSSIPHPTRGGTRAL